MIDARDDLNGMLKQDLTDFLLFFLFEKYLSSFDSQQIPLITKAISSAWRKRVESSSNFLDNNEALSIMQNMLGEGFTFKKELKTESDQLLKEEIDRLCIFLDNMGVEALFERQVLESRLSLINNVPKKNKQKNTENENGK